MSRLQQRRSPTVKIEAGSSLRSASAQTTFTQDNVFQGTRRSRHSTASNDSRDSVVEIVSDSDSDSGEGAILSPLPYSRRHTSTTPFSREVSPKSIQTAKSSVTSRQHLNRIRAAVAELEACPYDPAAMDRVNQVVAAFYSSLVEEDDNGEPCLRRHTPVQLQWPVGMKADVASIFGQLCEVLARAAALQRRYIEREAELEKENRQMKKEIKRLGKQSTVVKQEPVEDLQRELDNARYDIRNLHETRRQQADTIRKLEEQIAAMSYENDGLRSERAETRDVFDTTTRAAIESLAQGRRVSGL